MSDLGMGGMLPYGSVQEMIYNICDPSSLARDSVEITPCHYCGENASTAVQGRGKKGRYN